MLLQRKAPPKKWEEGSPAATFNSTSFSNHVFAAIFFLHLKAAGEGDGDELDKEYVPWAQAGFSFFSFFDHISCLKIRDLTWESVCLELNSIFVRPNPTLELSQYHKST